MEKKLIFVLFIFVISVASVFAISGNVIVAHRGASNYEVENSFEAFERAIELKADMIEFDVQKTLDGELVIFHDKKIKGKQINKINYSYIEENTEYHVPLLEEVLKLLSGRTKIDIDLKGEGYERDVIELSLVYFNESDVIISSRSKKSIKKIESGYDVNTMLILGSSTKEKISLFFGFLPKKKIIESQTDYLAINNNFLGKRLLNNAEKLGKPVFVWNVGKNIFIESPKVEGVIVKNPEK